MQLAPGLKSTKWQVRGLGTRSRTGER